MKNSLRAMAAAIALIQPVLVAAQTSSAPSSASPPASAAPMAPTASAPSGADAGGYRSAFEGYRAYDEQPVGSWREANQVVRQIGGWQAYAREAQGMGDAAGAAPAGQMPAAHGGMQMPGSAAASRAAGPPAAPASSSHSKHH